MCPVYYRSSYATGKENIRYSFEFASERKISESVEEGIEVIVENLRIDDQEGDTQSKGVQVVGYVWLMFDNGGLFCLC